MSEKLLPSTRRRLEYGAVPLRPWTAPHPDMAGENYYHASLRHIRERLDGNIHIPIENGTINSPESLEAIHQFCELSLTDAHNRRINHHHTNNVDKTLQGPDEIVKAAEDGTATPAEMLGLLLLNPHLEAIEMAKLTHPFDGEGDRTMMDAINCAIEAVGGVEVDDVAPRYKTKRADSDIPALVVLKKRPIAVIEAHDGFIEIIERKSFLVRGDAEVIDEDTEQTVGRLAKRVASHRATLTKDKKRPEQIGAETKLFTLINDAHTVDNNPQPWLDVLTTSVYARYQKTTLDV